MMVDCVHAITTTHSTRVRCQLGLFAGNPHVAMCQKCLQRCPGKEISSEVELQATNTTRVSAADLQDKPPAPKVSEFAVEEIKIANERAAICKQCGSNQGVTTERNGWPIYTVRCSLCGCNGLSLIRGSCRADKWNNKSEILPPEPTQKPAKENQTDGRERLLLRMRLSPGDAVVMTAAVRDLHRAFPGRFSTTVDTAVPELWEHNPNIAGDTSTYARSRVIDMQYPLIHQSNQRPYHFLHGYIQYLESQLGLKIPVTEFKGDVHLSDEEKQWMNQVEETFGYKGSYWIMIAGGKFDFTAKWWSPDFYQQVIDHFSGRVQFVQCGEKGHWHPELKNVFNLIGKTSIRQFIRLMYHAAGVVCPVTMAMHLAAAVPTKNNRLRPCVVVAGGREPPHWEAYPGHQFLHTIGALPCCATGGCWKSRCQLVGDNDPKDRHDLCERPVQVRSDLRIPQCMMMIKPEDVIAAIERSLTHG